MKIQITDETMLIIANYMADEIREELHSLYAPCSAELFLTEYLKRDPKFIEILEQEHREIAESLNKS